ncbi:MAG: hypothetical protein NNA31_01785 [Nitrospira sp.]|nr:hypothetical protein [Nitrospira sp.]
MMGSMVKIVRDRLPDCQPADGQDTEHKDDRKDFQNPVAHGTVLHRLCAK